jgi:hypothetical protein
MTKNSQVTSLFEEEELATNTIKSLCDRQHSLLRLQRKKLLKDFRKLSNYSSSLLIDRKELQLLKPRGEPATVSQPVRI